MSSVAVLALKPVGEIEGHFVVPDYQRGYRWGRQEVGQLLDDLWEGARKDHAERYCLQPVVVKRLADGSFELVDGQQRLTTIYLLLAYLRREGLKNIDLPYTITYATRDRCAEFLMEVGAQEDNGNIDFFHISSGYRVIAEWFAGHGRQRQLAADELYRHLARNVSVIWYEAPPDVDSNYLFRRLNHGRIPLTNAELIKALLFTGRGALRREEVAAQWDVIERGLREPEFWSFLANLSDDAYPTRIELLFDLMAGGPTGRARPSFHTFDVLRGAIVEDPVAFWNRVLELHARVEEWFENRDLRHWIGYLIAVGEPLRALVDAAGNLKRKAFREFAVGKVRTRLNLRRTDVEALSYDTAAGRAACKRALLLMNIETVRIQKNSAERYSFRQDEGHQWSLEHIHAQHAEGMRSEAQRSAWLGEHRGALPSVPMDAAARSALEARMLSPEALTNAGFEPLVREVVQAFTASSDTHAEALHGIANLALLSRDDNSALGNSVFEVKRQRVLQRDRDGAYIPVCTRRVFLKYYTASEGQQLHFWGPRDREGYLKALLAVLSPYLTAEGATA